MTLIARSGSTRTSVTMLRPSTRRYDYRIAAWWLRTSNEFNEHEQNSPGTFDHQNSQVGVDDWTANMNSYRNEKCADDRIPKV